MNFRPLHDRVVIRRIESNDRTPGGIIIPDTAKEKPQEGEVIAVGPGARDETGRMQPLDVRVGDRILFGKWSGTEVRIVERKDWVEDAMHATRAAVEEGIVPGGGTALLYAARALDGLQLANDDQRLGIEIVRRALRG